MAWFPYPADAINDHRVQGLSASSFKAWVNVQCVHAKYPDSTISDADMAWRLRLNRDEWDAAKAELLAAGLVTNSNKPSYADAVVLRLSGLKWAEVRARIFARDNHTCRYCGATGVDLECDHVIPISRAGSNDDDNLVTACRPCNRAKRDKLVSLDEWKHAMNKKRAAQ